MSRHPKNESENHVSLHRRTALTTAAAATVLLLSLSGCSSPASPESAATTSTTNADAPLASLVPAAFKDGINVASGIYAPMVMRSDSGEWSGFDYDLGQALSAELGVPFTFEVQDFTSIIPSLQSKKHDIIMFGMNDTAKREEVLDFTDYFQAGLAILVEKGNPEGITSLADLCGKSVAVAKGTTQAEFVASESTKCASGSITSIELPTENDAILAVKSGQAVADVFDAAPAAHTAQTSGDGNDFEVVHDPTNPSGYGVAYTGIGVLKENADLTKALEAALQAVMDDGTYTELLAKYDLSDYGVPSAIVNGATK
ncbi:MULTISPECIES: ABC transporter substrate-binding protein [Microbacterium]|uniref:ABC transporter substrate-binding protein n=1 Tax=Microbacterium TaxID=33882 RepID=UPI002785FCE3|nr:MULTISPECIES: ABC transporter substrate-binding protein [Microbacterium]MDQ1084371.1 polar amino acid transport system substrate-binding protein [Microbacterium sp. SORGH_AS_0344]MDQ1170354.1 polar amino acid transport system substrate-binding protein [Microbacterium proteolyticum]